MPYLTYNQTVFFFFGERERGKKGCLIHLLHESPAPYHCLPAINNVILCHVINVSQLDFTRN